MRKKCSLVLLVFATTLLTPLIYANAQNGYLVLKESDSLLVGYLKYYRSIADGYPGIELWKTKRDQNPRKIPKDEIYEYAIDRDTFRVLTNFKPFHGSDAYFDVVDALLISKGKVSLYKIPNYQSSWSVSMITGGGMIPAAIDHGLPLYMSQGYSFMYVLEDNSRDYLQGLPSQKKELQKSLLEFFPDRYISRYQQEKSKIRYKTIPDLVRLYNSK